MFTDRTKKYQKAQVVLSGTEVARFDRNDPLATGSLTDYRHLLPGSVVRVKDQVIEILAVRCVNGVEYDTRIDGVEENPDYLSLARIDNADRRGQCVVLSGGWSKPKQIRARAWETDGEVTDIDFPNATDRIYDENWWALAYELDNPPLPTYLFLNGADCIITYPQL